MLGMKAVFTSGARVGVCVGEEWSGEARAMAVLQQGASKQQQCGGWSGGSKADDVGLFDVPGA
jgi:hypothetical protein